MVGEAVEHGPLARAIADRDAQRFEAAEHVELGDRQRGHAVDPHRVAQGDQVHPATAALAAGRRPVLVALLQHVPADLVLQLGGEGARPDAGRVGLGDTPDLVDVARADAGPDRRRAGNRVG